MEATSICPGCGLELAESDGPTHPYIGASAACWALYGELLARQYAAYDAGPHKTSVDAYAVQHPGVPEPRSVRSVSLHLVRLCLMLERGVGGKDAARLMVAVGDRIGEFAWLDPPDPNGTVTVRDVLEGAADTEGWAHDVWAAWAAHHEMVREWISRALPAGAP
jgi:hypothetical protein